MVLVDTSVWIRFLADRLPHAEKLSGLLALDEVAGHDLVYGELLIGDCGGRQKFLTGYQKIHQARTVSHHHIVEFVRHRRLQGRGVGWIDMHLLASSLVEQFQLWTVDPRFLSLAWELGVAYEN